MKTNAVTYYFATGGIASLVAATLISIWLPGDVGDALTRNTIRVSLAWYAVALGIMIFLSVDDWQSTASQSRMLPAIQLARWCWTWAAVCFLVHVGMAFHYFHHWSHIDAFERTRAISGNGEGIYVSYLFSLLWIGDVTWWWLRPSTYATRTLWVGRVLHGSMLFIVFNGMVVFATGPIRWFGIVMFAALSISWAGVQFFRRPQKKKTCA